MPSPVVRLKVRLILYHKDRILLLKQTKSNGGSYTLVGGNVENNETARESLVRESWEEAGLEIRVNDLKLVYVLHRKKNKRQRLTLFFETKKWDGELRARERHKFKEAEWYKLNSLPKNLKPHIRQVLEDTRKHNYYGELFP